MKKSLTLILFIALFIGNFSASAQRDSRINEEHVVTIVVNEDEASSDDVEKAFKQNGPESPNDNAMPRFAIVGKNNLFYLGLGAQFLGEAVFDWGDNMPSSILMVPSAMTAAGAGNRSNLGFGWQSSSIYFNVVALPSTRNQIGVFLKLNFMGNNNAVSVYHLYAKYRGLTAGYHTSLFTDGGAMPFTLDFQGPNGFPYLTLFNASWTQKLGSRFTAAAGIDAPSGAITTSAGTEVINQRIPAIPLYLQYDLPGSSGHIRLSGLLRPLQYRDLVAEKNRASLGGAIQLSGMANPVGPLSVQLNAIWGKGVGTYIQDDNGLGLDAVPASTPGHLELPATTAFTAGLNYAFTPRLSGNLVYSHLLNSFNSGASLPSDTYRYGDYAVANLIFAINKFASVGLEYDYAHRKTTGGNSLHTNRLQCQFAVTF